MKKLVLVTLLVVVAGSLVSWNYALTKKRMKLSDLALSNIEVLANTEDTGEKGTGLCYKTITTQVNSKVLYCGTCTFIKNSKASFFSGEGECK